MTGVGSPKKPSVDFYWRGSKAALKHFLRGPSSVLGIVAGLSFFFGGRVIHEFGRVDRTLAEIMGIALAFLCLIGIAVAQHAIDDIEWQEANERGGIGSKATRRFRQAFRVITMFPCRTP